MKKTWLTLTILTLYTLTILTITLPSLAQATPTTAIDIKADHTIEIKESGLLIIKDTITLTKLNETAQLPNNYTLGFPHTYQSNLAYTFAYETQNPNQKLPLELNAGIGRTGFYAVKATIPTGVNQFTVVFVFSNSISFMTFTVEETQVTYYNASFPAYPTLPQTASEVNLKIITPTSLNYTSSSFEQQNINLTRTTQGSTYTFSHLKSNLTEFTDQRAWLHASKQGTTTPILDISEIERKIEISGNQQITVSDSYKMVNKAGKLTEVGLKIQAEAYQISAFDEFGTIPDKNLKTQQGTMYTNVTITPSLPSAEGDEVHILIQYKLPWKKHVTVQDLNQFNVSLSLFENTDWAIRKLTVTIALPEGATLDAPLNSQNIFNIQNTAFSSSLIFAFQNATPLHDSSFAFTYQRQILWDSFRPTVWIGTFVLAVTALAGAWHMYKPLPTAPLPTAVMSVRAEDLKNFISYYDEKRRLLRETGSLEAAARKGRIPRRQYKVRRMTIDSRMSSLSRDLAALRDKLRKAGPRYAEMMRQLEVAETELQGVETDIGRTEIRYRRGEISTAAYHKLLEDSYRRRDRSQTTVDGVLLRLREEIT